MVGLIIFTVFIASILAYAWMNGIDYMSENHPDYKGEDFLNWDENKSHTEGEI